MQNKQAPKNASNHLCFVLIAMRSDGEFLLAHVLHVQENNKQYYSK
jgi:hypothetical protein